MQLGLDARSALDHRVVQGHEGGVCPLGADTKRRDERALHPADFVIRVTLWHDPVQDGELGCHSVVVLEFEVLVLIARVPFIRNDPKRAHRLTFVDARLECRDGELGAPDQRALLVGLVLEGRACPRSGFEDGRDLEAELGFVFGECREEGQKSESNEQRLSDAHGVLLNGRPGRAPWGSSLCNRRVARAPQRFS